MLDSLYKQWAEMVASGGADSLFASYPEDAELAEKINDLLRGPGRITKDQIRRDRQRFHQLPRRGDMREEQPASPTKNVILNKASTSRRKSFGSFTVLSARASCQQSDCVA